MLKTERTKIPVDQEEEWTTVSSKDETRGVTPLCCICELTGTNQED